MVTTVHPAVLDLAFLLGTWQGTGAGHYPTIDMFSYEETVEFANPGKPFVTYVQRTRRTGDHPEAGLPLHVESGFLRLVEGGRVEMTVAQPTGIVEIQTGTLESGTIHLRSQLVGLTPTAKQVASIERRIVVAGDDLRYDVWMAAVGEAHQHHLEATLHRVG